MAYKPPVIPKLTPLSTATPNSLIFEEVPTNYDDALTYMEFLLAVLKKVNSMVESVNTVIDSIDGMAEEVERVTARLDVINDLISEITATISIMQADIANNYHLIENLQNNAQDLQNQINALPEYILAIVDQKDTAVKVFLQNQINDISDRIDGLNASNLYGFDPASGLRQPIQEIINSLYDVIRVNALTAVEYDNLELSAQDYDNEELTAYNYDFNARLLLDNA